MTKRRPHPPTDPRATLAVWPALMIAFSAPLVDHVHSWWALTLLVTAYVVLAAVSGLLLTMGRSGGGRSATADPEAERLASLEPLHDLDGDQR